MLAYRLVVRLDNTLPSVLIVEDDPDMRNIERAIFEVCGYRVCDASNGAEALTVLERSSPDVIVLDLMMPVMDGLSFLRERRARHVAEDVPVVCVTAAGEAMSRDALRLGAQECIAKPPDFDVLCEHVGRYVQM